jgi:hypothetical protein
LFHLNLSVYSGLEERREEQGYISSADYYIYIYMCVYIRIVSVFQFSRLVECRYLYVVDFMYLPMYVLSIGVVVIQVKEILSFSF